MTRAWKGCARIAMKISKLVVSGCSKPLQILGHLLWKRFESTENTKKWFLEEGRKAVRSVRALSYSPLLQKNITRIVRS